jgi:RimJ/RimL family protein N-acetyltransferase
MVQLRHDVGEATAQALERLALDEPAFCDPDSRPVHHDDYLRLLAAEGPVETCDGGLIWTFPERLHYEHPARLVASDTPDGDGLLARLTEQGMPEPLAAAGFVDVGELWAPWCVAFGGGDIASIAFTPGLGPASAETGVYTAPNYRGRGFASVATAGWAALPALEGLTLFYATTRTNVSSQRVAQRLGLRFIGVYFAIT